jgi:hypothetical protein
MCIKYGKDELSTVKALMSMSLNAIIADVFDMDLDDIKLELNLRTDMQMSDAKESELKAMVAEYFDDLQVDFSQIKTLADLFDLVIEQEFRDISTDAL